MKEAEVLSLFGIRAVELNDLKGKKLLRDSPTFVLMLLGDLGQKKHFNLARSLPIQWREESKDLLANYLGQD